MAFLLTGGTGTTTSRLARLLDDQGHPVIVASRKGSDGIPAPLQGVKFDWFDESTWKNPFSEQPEIRAVYLVSPPAVEGFKYVLPFIDLCIEKGVKRFVLLSASPLEKGGSEMGKVHEYLEDKVKVEWCVLRPSWFFQNFVTQKLFGIVETNAFISATENGKLGVISADDIADEAYRALTDEVSHNTDHILVGPELLSYDEMAEQLSEVVGRRITHIHASPDVLKEYFVRVEIPELASFLTSMDIAISKGSEERIWESPKVVHGKRRIRDYFEENKDKFIKKS